MTNGELLNIIEQMGKNGGPTIGEIAANAGLNRSYLSTFINLDKSKPVTKVMLRKLRNAYPAYFGETNKSNDQFAIKDSNTDNQAIIIDHSLFLQLIAEKEARRLDAEEKAKQAREDLMDAKEEKKELLAIIKENLTALQISSAKNQEYLVKIYDEQTSDDLVMMDNQDVLVKNPKGTSAEKSGKYQVKLATARKEAQQSSGKGRRMKAGK